MRRVFWLASLASFGLWAAEQPENQANGDSAVARLKQSGTYDSLKQAWQRALYDVERKSQDAYSARNTGQALQISFQPSGTRLVHELDGIRCDVVLRFAGYGTGDRMEILEPARLLPLEAGWNISVVH